MPDDQLEQWVRHVCQALELPPELAKHEQLLLDVARDAAHNVMRPAAPLTTFLVGVAAGRAAARGMELDTAVGESATVAGALAAEWPT